MRMSFILLLNVVWSHKFLVYQSGYEKSGQLNFRLVVLVDERFEKQREWGHAKCRGHPKGWVVRMAQERGLATAEKAL